jgi:predicted peptidase
MQNNLLSMLGGILSADFLSNIGKQSGEIVSRTVRIENENFDYQIYVPPNVETIVNLPLTVFLHGIRERGSGGLVPKEGAASSILKQYLRQIPSLLLLPQCRPNKFWNDSLMDKMVTSAIEQSTEEFNTDAKRIYLSGVSMGGYGVWHFASQYPKKFAALVSICGGSPIVKGERFAPIAEKVGKTPAWLFHGAEDKIVPVSESRQMVEALEANAGIVKYSEFAGVGHNVWFNALGEKDLLPWLLAQQNLK